MTMVVLLRISRSWSRASCTSLSDSMSSAEVASSRRRTAGSCRLVGWFGLANWLVGCIFNRLVGWLIGWLGFRSVGWVVGWLLNWLVGWLVNWLVGCIFDRLVGWFVCLDCWIFRSVGWLGGWLGGWFVGSLVSSG